MKKAKLLLAALGLAAALPQQALAYTESPYTLDFNTPIATADHSFRVASNWRHIVDFLDTDYVSYYYDTTGGVDGSGCLKAGVQEGRDYDYDIYPLYDLLVTPVISGEISFAGKLDATYGYIQVYTFDENGNRSSAPLHNFNNTELNRNDWSTVSFTLDTPQRVGLRIGQAYIDNFTAASAELEVEKSLTIVSAVPVATACYNYSGDGSKGTIDWYQQPPVQAEDALQPGNVLVQFLVTVKNDGEADLTQGEDNFSVSIFKSSDKTVYGTTPVPQDLAQGATSEPFVVEASVPTSAWSYAGGSINLNLRDNLMGGVLNRTSSRYIAYEPKFVCRELASTSTSSLSSAVKFGMTRESVKKELEIFNDGAAPLTIKSITVPEGFTFAVREFPAEGETEGALVEGEFTMEKKTKKALTVTLPATTPGMFEGNLTIVYLDKDGAEKTYTLPLSGTVLGENTWSTTFDNPAESGSTVVYPAGSIAENGISSGNTGYGANADVYLKSYTSTSYQDGNNKFITPKLRAKAGDVLSFDVARDGSNSTYSMKVYVSTDRQNWGDPVATYLPGDFASSAFEKKSISFDQAGDYYVGFAIFGMRLDNVAGLEKVEVTHDIYMRSVSQNESLQGGKEFSSTLYMIPLTDEEADAYTVKFFVNNEAVMTIPSLALTASANRETQFNAKWTPEVEQTVTYPTYFEIEFTDGTKFTSPVKNVTIEVQPEFVFFNKGQWAGEHSKPDSRKDAISFGKLNTPNATQQFEIYNWGAAPLTVNSITLPEGFAANYTNDEDAVTEFTFPMTVAPKTRQAVDIVLTATEAGVYSGNLSIGYIESDGSAATFELPVSATLLDPSKWYVTFDDGTTTGVWPAGSLHQSNVSLLNTGNYSAANMSAYSTGTTDNFFITPKLSATEGETLAFDAKSYSSSYYKPILKVYASETREGLENDEQRTLLVTLDTESENEETKLTSDFQTFTLTMPATGDYYLGFQLIERAYLDEIYGLTLAPATHDLQLAGSLIPPTATQNQKATAVFSVRNFGIEPEAAGSYTLTAYVNGEAQTIEGDKEIPLANAYNAPTTSFDIPFRSPKAGTFPVYLEFKTGDFVLTTEPQDVTFAEETLASDVVVGTIRTGSSATDGTTPFNFGWKNSETVALYTAEDLGLNGGEKISKITIKGYCTQAGYVSDVAVFYQWVDETEEAKPAEAAFSTEGMTQVVDLADYAWQAVGSSSEHVDMLTIQFPEPLVYPAGKSLRLKFHAYSDAYKSGGQFQSSTWNKNCWQRQNDGSGKGDIKTKSWSSKYLPVLNLSLVVTPISISGNVTDTEGNAAEGATVTLVSTDGDNIQYEGTTDATGAYNVNVIQSSRTYDVIVTKDGKEDYADAVEFPESKTTDFTLYEVANLNDETNGVTAIESALVKINLGLKPGFNAIALPVALTSDEVAAIFGEDAKVYEFVSVDGEIDATAHFFAKTDGMEAGVPYLLELAEAPAPFKVKGRAVVADTPSVAHYAVNFTATYAPMAVTDGMFFLTADNYIATTAAATHGLSFADNDAAAETLPAFRAYVKQREGRELQTLHFDILTDYTGIEGVAADFDENAEIYNLQGIRVKNPVRGGVYIVNGKKVLVK